MKCSYDQRPSCNTLSVLFAHVSQLTLHIVNDSSNFWSFESMDKILWSVNNTFAWYMYKFVPPCEQSSLQLFFEWGREKALAESHQAFKVTTAQTSGLVNYFLSCQTGFFKSKHLFIDKPMVKTEPAVSGTWLLGLGSKLLIIPTCSTCSTKILLNSCRVFLEYVKIEQAKERLFW